MDVSTAAAAAAAAATAVADSGSEFEETAGDSGDELPVLPAGYVHQFFPRGMNGASQAAWIALPEDDVKQNLPEGVARRGSGYRASWSDGNGKRVQQTFHDLSAALEARGRAILLHGVTLHCMGTYLGSRVLFWLSLEDLKAQG